MIITGSVKEVLALRRIAVRVKRMFTAPTELACEDATEKLERELSQYEKVFGDPRTKECGDASN